MKLWNNTEKLEMSWWLLTFSFLLSACSLDVNILKDERPSQLPTNPVAPAFTGLSKTTIFGNLDYEDRYDDMATDSNDRIYLVGFMNSKLVVRSLNADGTSNVSFADGGIFLDPIQTFGPTTITLQSFNGVERLIVSVLSPWASSGCFRFYGLDLNGNLIPDLGGNITIDCKRGTISSNDFQAKKSGDGSLYFSIPRSTGFLNILKLGPTGTVDTSYGTQGIAAVSAGFSNANFSDFFVHSNGTVAILAYRYSAGFNSIVAKVLPNGVVDTSLAGSYLYLNESTVGFVKKIATDSSGRFILVGHTGSGLKISRYSSTGTLDTSFGTSGFTEWPSSNSYGISAAGIVDTFTIVGRSSVGYMNWTLGSQGALTHNNSLAQASLALSADYTDDYATRKIIAGTNRVYMLTKETKIQTAFSNRLMSESLLYVFDAAGNLSPDFNNGQVRHFSELRNVPIKISSEPQVFSTSTNNQIYVDDADLGKAGFGVLISSIRRNGELDINFGNQGAIILPHLSLGKVILRNDESLLISGILHHTDFTYSAQIYKLTPSGTLDLGFGTSGVKTLPLPVDYELDSAYPLLTWQAEDGTLVSAAKCYDTNDWSDRFCLWKLNAQGNADISFGNSGFISHLGTSVYEQNFLHKKNNDLILYGTDWPAYGSMSFDWTTGAFKTASSITYNFGDAEVLFTGVDRQGRFIFYSLILDSNGEFVETLSILRFLPDGTLDNSFNSGAGFTLDLTSKPDLIYPTRPAFESNGGLAVGVHSWGSGEHMLVRLDESGSLVTDFGDSGILSVQENSDLAGVNFNLVGLFEKAQGGFMLLANPKDNNSNSTSEILRYDF